MPRTVEIERSLRILVPTDWGNEERGAFLEKLANRMLTRQSYETVNRLRFTGMEIDLLARHKPSGDQIYVECKFHERPLSANVIDLMVGQGIRKKIRKFALFSASELGKEASGAVEEIKAEGDFSFSFYGPNQILDGLMDASLAPQLPSDLPESISHVTLLVHPEFPYLWLLQEQKDGRPSQALIIFPPSTEHLTAEDVRAMLDKFGVLDGLPLREYGVPVDRVAGSVHAETSGPAPEAVSLVTTADELVDYRPCKPEYFIGRTELQNQFIKFLGDVASDASATRIISYVGSSGFGKSSLVAKLARRLRNKTYRSKYFMYPVDVRSARGALFVAEALLAALRSAAESGFLTQSQAELRVEDADNILAGESISRMMEWLESQEKVLVLFFDQFEEALTKDELVPLFRAFRRFALDANALKGPLVIGFSWRTGISFSDENPAYQMWNELRDHRITKNLGVFDSSESSKVITQFETALGQKFVPPLRRRLMEQGQGLPWLLKKLCIHVYGQISEKSVSQFELIQGRLNVSALFDEDLEHLTDNQVSCLRYIAENSPADSTDVADKYGFDVLAALSERRLVIRAGQKYAVYWDIFRDYLIEGRVPFIPLTYLPNTTLSMALSAAQVLGRKGALTTLQLAIELGYSESTVVNIVTDLQNLAVCDKDDQGRHRLVAGESLAIQLRRQFSEHIVYQRLLAESVDGAILRKRAVELVGDLYSGSGVKAETRANYLKRLVPWFEYVGLIEQAGLSLKVMPITRQGSKFGSITVGRRGARGPLFLGSAPPEKVVALLSRLQSELRIEKSALAGQWRNPATDLVALKLAFWTQTHLQLDADPKGSAKELVVEATKSAGTYRTFSVLLGKGVLSRSGIGEALAEELDRNWKPSSALRYANGLYAYHSYLDALAG